MGMHDFKKGEWNRDGDLLFTVEHAGWHKGEEAIKNRIMVRVEATHAVPKEEVQALIARLHELLKANIPVSE